MATAADKLAALKAKNELAAEKLRALEIKAKAKAAKSLLAGPTRRARYDSERRTRIRPGPRPHGGSADRHLTASTRSRLKNDCQDLERNSTIARMVIRRAQQLIAADGPIVTASTGDAAWDKEADRIWGLFEEGQEPEIYGHPHLQQRLSFAEMLAAIVSAWCTDGDILAVRTTSGGIQLIESERVFTPNMQFGGSVELKDGGRIVDGVETDAAGVARRYHVGDWGLHGALVPGKTRPVAAEHALLLTNPIGVRIGMTRGEPALQAVIDRIERLDQYDIKTAIAAEIATYFAAIHHSDDPAGVQLSMEAGASQDTGGNPDRPRTIDLEPGTLTFLNERGKVTGLKPEYPTTNFRDYVLYQVMVIGAELGLPLVATIYDASGLSWSNIKALLNLSLRSIEPAQARLARFVRWVRNWKILEWIEGGYLAARDDFARCDIVMPRAPVVDFASEVKGYREAIDARLMTYDQATQALGTGRFDDVAGKLASEIKKLRKLDIPAMGTPGAKGDAGAGSSDQAKSGGDEDETKDDGEGAEPEDTKAGEDQ